VPAKVLANSTSEINIGCVQSFGKDRVINDL